VISAVRCAVCQCGPSRCGFHSAQYARPAGRSGAYRRGGLKVARLSPATNFGAQEAAAALSETSSKFLRPPPNGANFNPVRPRFTAKGNKTALRLLTQVEPGRRRGVNFEKFLWP